MVLITGRQLEHWHTGAMTRRAGVLDAIEPEPVASLHPLDLDAIGVKPGDVITVESRRGKISLYARADDGTPRGAVFIPFCFYEAAANLLTNPALDPFGKIPEFKYCAVRVTRGRRAARRPGLRQGAYAVRTVRLDILGGDMPLVAITREMGSLGKEVAEGPGAGARACRSTTTRSSTISPTACACARATSSACSTAARACFERLTADKTSLSIFSADEIVNLALKGSGAA